MFLNLDKDTIDVEGERNTEITDILSCNQKEVREFKRTSEQLLILCNQHSGTAKNYHVQSRTVNKLEC
jgi:hypothetical protein